MMFDNLSAKAQKKYIYVLTLEEGEMDFKNKLGIWGLKEKKRTAVRLNKK